VDDNANLSHENPGPEETCDVGAIEKLAYDLWLARGCPVGCPEVDWFEAERQLNGTRESSGLSRPNDTIAMKKPFNFCRRREAVNAGLKRLGRIA
jgi:hypothetical protein